MPSPRYDWPRLIVFTTTGKKPRKADLPGLEIGPGGRYPNGKRIWNFWLEGLYAN